MDSLEIKVNAKINLSLDITGMRVDGYHILDTVVSSVDIFDVVSARKSDISKVIMDGQEADGGNTAVKALRLLRDRLGIAMQVEIVKGIPFCAGLGGSSADASGVLFCASKLYDIPSDTLIPLALEVGCDVPYMMTGGGARVQGVGEVVIPTDISPMTLVVAQKCVGSSTKEIYRKYDEVGGEREGRFFNVLERSAVTLKPQIAVAKEQLQRYTNQVFMTGSGSAYVGIFDSEDIAKKCCEDMQDCVFCKLAHTQDSGIEIISEI